MSRIGDTLYAGSISSYVDTAARRCRDRGMQGHVVNVFRTCVNWVNFDGELFSMTSPGAGNVPHGVVVEGAEDFASLGITVGAPVNFGRRFIHFEPGVLRVDLAKAKPWCPSPTANPGVIWDPRCVAAAIDVFSALPIVRGAVNLLPQLQNLALDRPVTTRDPGPVEMRLTSAARSLAAAIRARDEAAFLDAADRLVGTGVGLTPAGDDILVGAICGLTTFAASSPHDPWFVEAVRALSIRAHGRTTQVSETFIKHAAYGRFPECLTDLLKAFESKVVAVAEHAARRLAQFGKTSGREMAFGALFAGASSANSNTATYQCMA